MKVYSSHTVRTEKEQQRKIIIIRFRERETRVISLVCESGCTAAACIQA